MEDVQPACFGLVQRPGHQLQVEPFALDVKLEGGDRLCVPRDLGQGGCEWAGWV